MVNCQLPERVALTGTTAEEPPPPHADSTIVPRSNSHGRPFTQMPRTSERDPRLARHSVSSLENVCIMFLF